ncbi:MAG: hypothetical protein JWO78_1565 [Micavibrio sp.]|nr:hypothetical protein [Micavibrio sp.]
MNALKKTSLGCAIVLGALFGQAVNAADNSGKDRLAQAAIGGEGTQIARSLYSQAANDAAFDKAKAALIKLPANKIREASSAYHQLAYGERNLLRSVGESLAWNDGRRRIEEISSPEMRAGLIALKQQIDSDKKNGDKTPPYDRMTAVVKKLSDESRLREDAFKSVVDQAVKEKFAAEHNQKPSR